MQDVDVQNDGRMIPLDSKVYSYMEMLYSRAGMTAPHTARPWSSGQARALLEQVPVRGAATADLAERIRAELNREPLYEERHFSFDTNPRVNAESFYALRGGDRGPAGEEEQWLHGYRERLPQFVLPIEFMYGEHFYILGDFELLEERHASRGSYGESNYSNWAELGDPKLDMNMPLRSFASAGGQWWFLQLGRDRHSWGNGLGENLLLSDESDYLEALNFRLFSSSFSYSGIYAQPGQFAFDYSADPVTADSEVTSRLFLAHRLEAVFWNRLNLSLTEGLMLAADDNDRALQPVQYLNLFFPFHNWHESAQGNSIMALEIEWRPMAGWGLYGQAAVDEFLTSYEAAKGSGEKNLFGWLFGTDWTLPAGRGFFTGYAEFVSTAPFMYLLTKNSNDARLYNVRRYASLVTNQFEYIVQPLGFSQGPDARSYSLTLQYERPGRYTGALSCSFLEKGEVDWQTKPTDAALAEAFSDGFPSGTVEYSLLFHLSGEYLLTERLAVQGDLYYRNRWNVGHKAGARGFDLETALGLRFDLY